MRLARGHFQPASSLGYPRAFQPIVGQVIKVCTKFAQGEAD